MALYQIDNVASPIDFQGKDMLKRTLQNAKNLLMCRLGEVPYDRYRGFDSALYDLPINRLQYELLPELDRILMWEPDAQAVEAAASILPDGSTYIRAVINVRLGESIET